MSHPPSTPTFKPLIAFLLAAGVCLLWHFDVVSILLGNDVDTTFGAILTGAIIAGGSKGAVKFFRDILGWRSRMGQLLDDYRAGDGPRPAGLARRKNALRRALNSVSDP